MAYCIDLSGKVAVVTGGYSGIGLAITKALLGAGARAIVAGRNYDKFIEAAKELEGLSGNFDFYELDIKNGKNVPETIGRIIKKESKIDILVNNAGITKDSILLRMTDDDWLDVIDVNLNGLFYVTRSVLKYMVRAKSGKIVNISSVVGETGNAGQANYASAKAGVIAFTKSAAKEYAPRNICINAVAPGFVATAMTEKLSENIISGIKEGIPLNRFGSPDDVALAALFLSSGMSDYITGTVIDVNGGMFMR